jgi:predicted small secreted protein
MNRIRLALIAVLTLLAVSACHTVEGFGKDVKQAGGNLEDAADKK